LLSGDRVLASAAQDMGRGQAEHLIPLLEGLLSQAAKSWADLSAIGVGTGPGNFTGIRISVSAARGLALGLDIPAIGVSTFEAIQTATPGLMPAVPGPRGKAYVLRDTPELIDLETLGEETHAFPPAPDGLAVAIGKVALSKLDGPHSSPAPLYVKPADAAPARDLPPVILDDA
jgi:tRNA threonylcarbamoyl adenosine modification protein YeaZ